MEDTRNANPTPGEYVTCMDDTGTGFVRMYGTDGQWHTLPAMKGMSRDQAIAAMKSLRIKCGVRTAHAPVRDRKEWTCPVCGADAQNDDGSCWACRVAAARRP